MVVVNSEFSHLLGDVSDEMLLPKICRGSFVHVMFPMETPEHAAVMMLIIPPDDFRQEPSTRVLSKSWRYSLFFIVLLNPLLFLYVAILHFMFYGTIEK
jgi:hypothetical protein